MKMRVVFEAICFATILACGPGRAAPTNGNHAAVPHGTAVFGDRLATADEFSLHMSGVADLSGNHSYQGWLVGSDGRSFLSLGSLQPAPDGSLSFRWDSPTSENLLGHYVSFQATVEAGTSGAEPRGSIAFSGSLSASGRSLFGPGVSSPSPVAVGMKQQTDLAVEHGGMAIAAQEIKARDEMRAHLEHVINILEGQKGKRFGDYLGTGVPQNPGDGYGVQAYEKEVFEYLGKYAAATADLERLDESFRTDLKSVEDACLAALSLTDVTKASQLMQDLKLRLAALQGGSVAELYRAAQKELALAVGPRS
jgi:hypothetical protein